MGLQWCRGLIVLAILLHPITVLGSERTLQHPPIPKESPTTERVAIVTFSKEISKSEIKKMLAPYPDIELRHVFREALFGFSVKGTSASLEKLRETQQVQTISPVVTYESEDMTNIQIIGGQEVRGIFDQENRRLTGKGVTVGVIDTGIDYTHQDLRRSYEGGHDLVDGDRDPMESRDEHGATTLHGTHVAGIIAANGRMNGVAPDAKVIAYRALGPGGSGTTEQVLAAIEQAIKDRVDVLNLSLGNNVNGPDLPISLALNKAADKGIVPVTSSGNSGPHMWTVGSPGTAAKAISVGASTPTIMTPLLKMSGSSETIKLQPMGNEQKWKLDRSYQVVYGGLGNKEELKDVEGKIALIKRGELTFFEKAHNAYEAGAVAVIIFNNLSGSFIGNLEGEVPIPVATVSKTEGHHLKKSSHQKEFGRINIIEEKDLLADFSSRGPVTSTWEIKPDVVAPGVAIQSTVPGGYLALQGTSMAAPHVAGAVALLKQAHPNWSPEQIKAALMNTAIPIFNQKGVAYRTFEQGAGRIRMDDAIKTKSLVMPASLQFGKFKLADSPHSHIVYATVENVGNEETTYAFQTPPYESGLTWKLPLSFKLQPKEKKRISIGMTIDPKAFKKSIQDGYLILQNGNQSIRIPYLYVLDEPNYPRVMGFDFGADDEKGGYQYEVYLPGGADEFGIALFHPDTYQFVSFLDTKRGVGKGMLKERIKKEALPASGQYIAKVFAVVSGQEDMMDVELYIESDDEIER